MCGRNLATRQFHSAALHSKEFWNCSLNVFYHIMYSKVQMLYTSSYVQSTVAYSRTFLLTPWAW
jgi:hypothetical protein